MQHTYEHRIFAGVAQGNLLPYFGHAAPDLITVDVHLEVLAPAQHRGV